MSCRIPKTLSVLYVAISLCHGKICETGDVTVTASECTDPDELFNHTVNVFPGSSITLTCSVMATNVNWNSSQFDMTVHIDAVTESKDQGGIAFQIYAPMIPDPLCSNATATIANIQESMDGLDLTCFHQAGEEFSSTVVINVIGPPPPPPNFMARQELDVIVVSWSNLSDDPCPITGYVITMNGSSVPLTANETEHTFPIFDECGSTLQINLSATNTVGNGKISTTNLDIIASPANLHICAVIEFNQTYARRNFLNMEWEMPLKDPGCDLTIEVDSLLPPTSLGECTTVHQIFVPENFTGVFGAMVYCAGHEGTDCFSRFEQINVPEEFSMVDVFTLEVSSDTAQIMLTINATVFTVTTDSLELSGGGVCEIADQTPQSLDLNCTGLIGGATYSLTIDLSVGDNYLIIVIFDTLPPPPTTPTSTSNSQGTMVTPTTESSPSPEAISSLPLIVGVVVVVIVIILLVIVVIVIIAIVKTKNKARKGSIPDDSDEPVALVERKKDPTTGETGDPAYAPPKQVPHEQAPTGETYAVVMDKPRRTAPTTPQADTNYQDPSTIQHEQAPTGDLYAMVNKDSKPMYSEVQKQPASVYADLHLKKGEQGAASHKPAPSEVLYTEVQQ